MSRIAAAGLFCVTAAGLTPAMASTPTASPVAANRVVATHITSVTPHRPVHGLVFKNAGYRESLVAASPYWLAAKFTDSSVWDPPPPPPAPTPASVVAAAVAPAVVVTRAPAAPVTPRATVVASPAPARPAAPASLSGAWACIAARESGGNPRAVNPSGYYGMFQFSLGTWHAVGGSGNPANASAQEQLMRAQMLQARSGWGQWSTAGSCGV